MDGRIQEPLRKWIASTYDIPYVDTVTQPGMDGVLAGTSNMGDPELARRMTSISVTAHGSKTVIISGHYDCAGHPVDEASHKSDIKKAVVVVRSWEGMEGVTVVGVWVNKEWKVESV